MTLYAQVRDGIIETLAPAPTQPGYGPDGWRDYSDPAVAAAYLADGGWLPVTETARPDDTATQSPVMTLTLTGDTVTQGWTMTDKSPEQIRRDAEQDARLDSLTDRVARLEAAQWPPPPVPTTPTDPSILTFAQHGGVVPAGSLCKDDGKVYRNMSGVPLTTAPSAMPGGPGPWTHLWAPVTIGSPPPATPAWSPTATYAVGAIVSKDGRRFTCLIAHGSERQGTWAPGVAPTIWQDIGPA